ncbi:MAG TPA: hypothetical protein VIP46_00925, partial [Pyrinomonadaceae bacterium]
MSTTAADFLAGLEPQTVFPSRAVGRAADARENPAPADELSAWLAALLSFFDPSNHPLTEAELASLGARNFVNEAGIAQQVLRRCLSLGLLSATGDESGRGGARAHAELLASLADLCALCDSL